MATLSERTISNKNTWGLITGCAVLSLLAYKNVGYIQRNYPNINVGVVQTNIPILGGLQAICANINGGTYIAFRGTSNLEEKIADIDINPIPRVYGDVCEGVYDVYDQLKDIVGIAQGYGNQPIFFTGHSLGGAVAQIATMEMAFYAANPHLWGIITFGQPAIGLSSVAYSWLNSVTRNNNRSGGAWSGGMRRFYRITELHDPVVYLPPFQRYAQGGQNANFDDLQYKSNPYVDDNANTVVLMGGTGPFRPDAHAMTRYYTRVSNMYHTS